MNDEETAKMEAFRQTIDKSTFDNQPYARRVEKPWGYEIHWVPDSAPYMGKMIHVNEGKKLSLQVHDTKVESSFVTSGEAILSLENAEGQMDQVTLQAGKGYTVKLGQKHRLIGGQGGCDIIEVSSPEQGNTYRIEDDYNRTTETEASRVERDRQATE